MCTAALVATTLSPPAHAEPAPAPSPTDTREAAFAAAAARYGVPQTVLEAVSYSQSRWEARAGHSTTGGYGPMHLVDGALRTADQRGKDDAAVQPGEGSLQQAARLTGLGEAALKSDAATNIAGGAALIAATQRRLGLPTGVNTDPGQWYAAVAQQSGSRLESSARTFADDTYAVLTSGAARTTDDGQRMSLEPTRTSPQVNQLAALHLARPSKNDPRVECPNGLSCEWVGAPYVDLGNGDYGNHDLANRPTSPKVTGILIHNTEASYERTLGLVLDPTYVSWHYTLRSSDGHIAQHVATKNVAWHAGNWYINGHSIGLEHEGWAGAGATWFSEPMYRSSARLVRYLAKEYDIPMDRQHIYGHDQVPGILPANVKGMHWDPGPYWNWEHYFQLLGAPLSTRAKGTPTGIVRILPGFAHNPNPVTSCDVDGAPVTCTTNATNFVYLHQAPSADSPLIRDIGLHPDGSASTTAAADIGARAAAGVEYAVADRQGDWTAIWFNGEKGWFHNPASAPKAINVQGSLVVPKAGLAAAPVYGRAYPEASAYPAGIPVQTVAPLQYVFAADQRYVVGDLNPPTDYYRASTFSLDTPNDHIDVVGQDRYIQISLGHRFAFVRAADVDVVTLGT